MHPDVAGPRAGDADEPRLAVPVEQDPRIEPGSRRQRERLRPQQAVGDADADVEGVTGRRLRRDGDSPFGVAEAARGPGKGRDVLVDDVDRSHSVTTLRTDTSTVAFRDRIASIICHGARKPTAPPSLPTGTTPREAGTNRINQRR